MPDVVRTRQELLDIFADASPSRVTKQNMRDFIVSVPFLDETVEYVLAIIQDSIVVTNITDAVYVDINAPLVELDSSIDMSVAPGEVTYIGASPKLFAYSISLNARKDSGSAANYSFSLTHSGTPVLPKISATLTMANLDGISLSGTVGLLTNETIKLQVRGDGTNEDIILQDLHLRLTEIRS